MFTSNISTYTGRQVGIRILCYLSCLTRRLEKDSLFDALRILMSLPLLAVRHPRDHKFQHGVFYCCEK